MRDAGAGAPVKFASLLFSEKFNPDEIFLVDFIGRAGQAGSLEQGAGRIGGMVKLWIGD